MFVNHYKSWSGLNQQLQNLICDSLKGRISYFLTSYHEVHNAYGRASIILDGNELVRFSWVEMCKRESDIAELYKKTGSWSYDNRELLEKWNKEAAFSNCNFLESATAYLQMNISDAVNSDNYLIRIFAILDRRVGKRTLARIKYNAEYLQYPAWIKQFYELRLSEIQG